MYTHAGSVVDTSVSMSPNESCLVVSVNCVLLVMEYVLCWPAIPGHWACPGVWLINPITLQWRKLIVPFASRNELQITSWLGVGLCVNFFFPMLVFCLFCTCAGLMCAVKSLCEFIYVSALLCLENTVYILGIIHYLWLFLPPSNINL